MRKPTGKILNTVTSFLFLFTFLLNLTCYFGVFMKMRAVQLKISGGHATSGESTKNHKVARIMMIFVFVYILQYWAFCVYSVWLVVSEPSIVILLAAVFFTNLGGVFNMLAYTLLRRKSVHAESANTAMAPQPSMATNRTVVVKSQQF